MAVFQVVLLDIGENDEQRQLVRQRICQTFNLSPEKVERLTDKLPRIVARGLKKKAAERQVKRFLSIGARAEYKLAMDNEKVDLGITPQKKSEDPHLTHKKVILVGLGETPEIRRDIGEKIAPVLEVSRSRALEIAGRTPVVIRHHFDPSKASVLAGELKKVGASVTIKPDHPPPPELKTSIDITASINEYVEQLISMGLPRKSIQDHVIVLNALGRFIGSTDIINIKHDELQDFQACMMLRNPDARDINLIKKILQNYYQFLERRGMIKRSLFGQLPYSRRNTLFSIRSLELQPSELVALESAQNYFQKSKSGLVKVNSFFNRLHNTSKKQIFSLKQSMNSISFGIQSIILGAVGILILVLLIYSFSLFNVFSKTPDVHRDDDRFFSITSELKNDVNVLVNWYQSTPYHKDKLESVTTMYELGNIISTNGPTNTISPLQNDYRYDSFHKNEEIFILKHRIHQTRLLIVNMRQKEAYCFNEGLSKKFLSWE